MPVDSSFKTEYIGNVPKDEWKARHGGTFYEQDSERPVEVTLVDGHIDVYLDRWSNVGNTSVSKTTHKGSHEYVIEANGALRIVSTLTTRWTYVDGKNEQNQTTSEVAVTYAPGTWTRVSGRWATTAAPDSKIDS